MRILIIYDVEGWAYWRRAVALQKHSPADFEVVLASSPDVSSGKVAGHFDLVFNLEYVSPSLGRLFPGAVNVVSYNSGPKWRSELWQEVVQNADFVIANNRRVWEFFGKQPRTCNISNGVDLEEFRTVPTARSANDWLWLGSERNAKLKGLDLARSLSFESKRHGFYPKIIWTSPSNRLRGDDLVKWYNSGSYFLCLSEDEGTPNPILESMACGCIPIATAVGNCPELIIDSVNGYLIKPTVQDAMSALLEARERRSELSNAARHTIKGWSWESRSRYFFALFRKLIAREEVSPFTWSEINPEEI